MTDAAPHRVRSEAKAPSHLYLEDFAVGQVYEAGPIPVSADAIKAYAHQFDPQPFHTDAELARSTFFQGLVASGWHTASLTMSLVVQALPIAGGVIGGGVDELRWPKPLPLATNCGSRVRSRRCGTRGRSRTKVWSGSERRRS